MIHAQLQDVFRQVFRDPALTITDAMSAKDDGRWDSLSHISLIVAVEKTFQVKFRVAEIARLNSVGDLKELIRKHRPDTAQAA